MRVHTANTGRCVGAAQPLGKVKRGFIGDTSVDCAGVTGGTCGEHGGAVGWSEVAGGTLSVRGIPGFVPPLPSPPALSGLFSPLRRGTNGFGAVLPWEPSGLCCGLNPERSLSTLPCTLGCFTPHPASPVLRKLPLFCLNLPEFVVNAQRCLSGLRPGEQQPKPGLKMVVKRLSWGAGVDAQSGQTHEDGFVLSSFQVGFGCSGRGLNNGI